MRIEQIELKNFGSYRDATIDLSHVASAVVLGPNGAGKSTAFIDAVLAALYGKARSSMDAMIRTGETDMMVAVIFSLNGQRYRVIRKRSIKTKAGKTDLELQVQQGGEQDGVVDVEWTPISGGRLNETQEKIVQLLNCDQDLLTATAFFLQGQADRFSRATPSERKAILASILRLDRYGALKQAASRQATRILDQVDYRKAQLTDLESTESGLRIIRDNHAKYVETEAQERQRLERLETQRTEQLRIRADLQVRLDGLADLVQRCQQNKQRLPDLKERERTLTEKHDRWAKILRNRQTIMEKVELHRTTTSAIASLEAAMADREQALATIDDQIQAAQTKQLELHQIETDLATAKREVQDAIRDYRRRTQDLQAALDRDRDQSTLLGQVPCDSTLQGRCQFTLKAVEAKGRIAEQELAIAARATEDDKIANLVASAIRIRIGELEDRALPLRQTDWADQIARAKASRLHLQQAQQHARESIQRSRTILKDLERFTVLVPELELAEREIESLKTDLANAIRDRTELDETIKTQELEQLAADQIRASLNDTARGIQHLESQIALAHETIRAAAGAIGHLVGQIEQAERTLETGKTLRAELAQMQRDMQQYRILADAYAIIPTLVMENALPILEHETNALLAKISRTGMRVRFDTQKALKSRDGLAETLDIAVRDSVGERPLENYSGGERFRLDLAQRIGLSKLLARRAGAQIETLAIDEGLGSLDEDGLNQLRECLGALGDDFKLVLVITHVDAMKATFPSQVMITKDQQGSHVEVLA